MKHAVVIERPYSWHQASTLWFESEQQARDWVTEYTAMHPNPKNGDEGHEKITLLSAVDVLSDESWRD